MGATMPSKGWQILVFKKLPNGYVEEVKNLIWDTINIYSLFKTGQGVENIHQRRERTLGGHVA
ncbi:hypothetical protein JHK82_040738 [Glycine max]|nr:hypothetical protein JHK86_040942 [Glycine max]KAG4966578.1 hypothetical protein JHK85_041553 [Glycine max]KAG5111515.1 hypothetical protein JHK82_040738 [Glycine max]KAG5122812.1 hypothetical protein JHK84_041152 [Glycine max]